MTPHQLSAATLNCHAAHYIGPEPRPGQKSRQTLLLGRPTQVVGAENFNLVFHFCHGSLGQRQGGGAFPCGKIFSPFWELAICAGACLGVDRCWGMGAVMPDGSYQADIMEDVAIWTATNFSCCNLDNPRRGRICKKIIPQIMYRHICEPDFPEKFLSSQKNHLMCVPTPLSCPTPLLWIHFVSVRASILFYSHRNHPIMESTLPAYQFYANLLTKYSSTIKGTRGGKLKAKQPHHWLFDCRELIGERFFGGQDSCIKQHGQYTLLASKMSTAIEKIMCANFCDQGFFFTQDQRKNQQNNFF